MMRINLVNVIPQRYSNETNWDAEPSIAINPRNTSEAVITAFTPDIDPMLAGVRAPIFYSTDSGSTWGVNSVIPDGVPGDITVRFGGTSGILYTGIINGGDESLNLLRTADVTAPGSLELLVSIEPRPSIVDQPWIESTVANGKDIVFLSGNDMRQYRQDPSDTSVTGRTAFIMVSSDAAAGPPPAGFTTFNYIESRNTDGRNLPSVRTAIHSSGVVYGTFFGVRSDDDQGNSIDDVVVVRDDNWGTNSFKSLRDTMDSKVGHRVVKNVTVAALGSNLGSQRVGSNLSIAVDPLDSRRIYVFWGDGANDPPSSPYVLHVRRSEDSGQSWTNTDLFSISNALNPCIAVNSDGVVGLLYQELVKRGGNNRWRTHFVLSKDHLKTVSDDAILADVLDVPNSNPNILVSIGDYCNLISVDKDFYGVFSAYNVPDLANFPKGVTYLRNHDFTTKKLLDVTNSRSVQASADPFFVHCQVD